MYKIMTPGPTQVPETVRRARSFACTNPDLDEEFYDFYKNKMIFLDAKPNKAHLKLAELEQAGKLLSLIHI